MINLRFQIVYRIIKNQKKRKENEKVKIKVIGKQNRQGTSKKTNKPYNFNEVHYVGKAAFVIGEAALTLNLDPANYPLDSIVIGAEYNVDFDGSGYVVDFRKA